MNDPGYTSSQSPQPRKRQRPGWRLVRNILLGALGAFVLLIIFIDVFGHANPSVPVATATQSAAAPAVPAPDAPASTVPATTAPAKPPAPVTVGDGHYSGSGDYNSAPFILNGNPVTVTYTYSGNIMAGETTGDNFIAGLKSSGDDQSIANTIAVSGGTTTTLYPDTAMGTSYHLSVQATGTWSFTLTETP